MSAEHGLGFELLQKSLEPGSGITGEHALDPIQAPRPHWIVSLLEEHSPEFRRVLDQFQISIRVNLAMKRREKLHQIKLLKDIVGPEGAPGLLQSCCRCQMAAACGCRCN